MKLFHETKIDLFSKRELKVCVISDIHFSYRVKNEKLNVLAEKLKNIAPSYIFIPGDLVDSNDMIKSSAEETRLLAWLEKLGKIATVIISEGNHDVYLKSSKAHKKETGDKWQVYKNSDFRKKVNGIENVHYLDNEKFEDKNIFVLSLSLSHKYYRLLESDKDPKSPGEDVDELLKELDCLDQNLITHLPKGKLKFALIHSPAHLNDFRVQAELEEFDFFVSGHMHNGLVVPIVSELWRGDRGVVSPSREPVAKNTRLSQKTLKNRMIITGAVTTWHESVGPFHNLNVFYPSYFTTLNFKNDSALKRKPNITRKYLNF